MSTDPSASRVGSALGVDDALAHGLDCFSTSKVWPGDVFAVMNISE